MFDNCHLAPKDIRDYLPHDCTNSPAPGKAFCVDHCDLLVKLKIPTGLREFIAYCKADSNAYSKEEISKVKVKLSEIANTLKKEKVKGTASYDSQGLSMILRNLGNRLRTQWTFLGFGLAKQLENGHFI